MVHPRASPPSWSVSFPEGRAAMWCLVGAHGHRVAYGPFDGRHRSLLPNVCAHAHTHTLVHTCKMRMQMALSSDSFHGDNDSSYLYLPTMVATGDKRSWPLETGLLQTERYATCMTYAPNLKDRIRKRMEHISLRIVLLLIPCWNEAILDTLS